jgi:hypothetical protein
MNRTVSRLAYKPVGIVLGAVAGGLAGMAFKRIWQAVSGEPDAPSATDESYGWGETLTAAALQGMIFAIVKAAVDRGGATGFRRLTGTWPD